MIVGFSGISISSLAGSRSSTNISLLAAEFNFERLFRVVNNLPFDWDVFVSFNFTFLGNILDFFFWDILGDVLSKIFDGIVVGDGNFSRNFFDSLFFSIFCDFSSSGYSFNSSFILVFNDLFLERNVLDSAFSLDDLFASVDGSVHNMRLILL